MRAKPVGNGGVGIKTMTGKKVALLVPVSQEIAMTNAAGLYSQLRQDLPTAIARAFDYAAIHGLDLRTGGAGPFADYLKQGVTSIELGTTSQANGGMYADLVTGEKRVVDAGYDFSGFAADPRLKPTLKLTTDTQGRPLWVDSPVDGRVERQPDRLPGVLQPGRLRRLPASGQPGAGRDTRRHPDRWHVHHLLRGQDHLGAGLQRRRGDDPDRRPAAARACRLRRSPARPVARTRSPRTWSVARQAR